jgi:hypothetical protein
LARPFLFHLDALQSHSGHILPGAFPASLFHAAADGQTIRMAVNLKYTPPDEELKR